MSDKKIFTISWKIRNFSLCNFGNRQCLKSPVFSTDNLRGTKWFLRVHPKGIDDDSEGFISFFLNRSIEDECVDDVCVSYKLEIIDFNGEILMSVGVKDRIFSRSQTNWGFRKFLEFEKLTTCFKSGEQDYFVFRCQAFHQNEQAYSLLYQLEMEYPKLNHSFQSKILFSDFQQLHKIVSSPFKTTLPFYINLTTSDDKIVLSIKYFKEQKLSLYHKVKITIQDDNDDEINLEKSECMFKSFDASDSVPFETSFMKSQVKCVKNNFPFYSFMLILNFSSYRNKLVKTLERLSYNSNFRNPDILPSSETSAIQGLLSKNFINSSTLETHDLSIQKDLKDLLQSEKLSDVKLRVGNEIMATHKCILSARSPVFSAMFKHNMIETETGNVDITDVDSEILQSFIEYLYTDTIKDTDWEQVLKLITVADKYQVSSLKDQCFQILASKLSVENACEVLSVAELISHADLKHFTMSFIKSKKERILSSPIWSEWVMKNVTLAVELLMKLATN